MCSGHDGPFEAVRIDAKDEVMTTLFTEGAFFLMAFKMPVVPITAGSMRSFCVSVTLQRLQVSLEPVNIWKMEIKRRVSAHVTRTGPSSQRNRTHLK